MGIKRATFFFQGGDRYGWSETHYQPDTVTIPQIYTLAQNLMPFRRALLGANTDLVGIRVSDDSERGDSLVIAYSGQAAAGGASGLGEGDIANTALLVRLQSFEPPYKTRGMLYLRGIPDNIVRNSGDYVPTGPWNNLFRQFIDALRLDKWGLRGATATPPVNIQTLSQQAGTGVITVITAAPHGASQNPPNNIVNIRGLRGFPGIRGRHAVLTVVDATTLTFRSKRVMPAYLGGGQLEVISAAFSKFDQAQIIRVTHRISGRPSATPVGRRSGR